MVCAHYLLPKWNGDQGDVEALAEELYKSIGGKQGAFVYFEISSLLLCQCKGAPDHPTLSWAKIKEGFGVMNELYGASMLKLNRYALMTTIFSDRAEAHEAFGRIGKYWEPEVWLQHSVFETYRGWAGFQPGQ